MSLAVRPYCRADREAVRRICCETADGGRPLESLLGERRPVAALRDLFADLLTVAYTDYEPSHIWVAGDDRAVGGYVMGTFDEARWRRTMRWPVVPVALLRAAMRGALFRRSVLALAWANRWPARTAEPPLRGYPAHLHINLAPDVRGGGVGRALVERFLDAARLAGVPGVTASVREDNAAGRAFFERLRFVPLARHRQLRLASGRVQYAVIHGRRP